MSSEADGNKTHWGIALSHDGRWLILTIKDDSSLHAKAYATLLPGQTLSDHMKWISIAPSYDYSIIPINAIDDILYVQTDHDALNGKIAKVKLDWSKALPISAVADLKDRLQLEEVIPNRPFIKMTKFYI